MRSTEVVVSTRRADSCRSRIGVPGATTSFTERCSASQVIAPVDELDVGVLDEQDLVPVGGDESRRDHDLTAGEEELVRCAPGPPPSGRPRSRGPPRR